MRLGEWMRRERVRADLTRKQVAARVGVGLNAIERWEAGARRPLLDSFVRWCEAVGVPLEMAIRQISIIINAGSFSVGIS